MEKLKYVQPEIEVLEVKIEDGFAASGQQQGSPWYEAGLSNSDFGTFKF